MEGEVTIQIIVIVFYYAILLFLLGIIVTFLLCIKSKNKQEESDEQEESINCPTCRFFKQLNWHNPGDGQCRRNAPKTDVCYPQAFPAVGTDSWCGEWEEKK